MDKQAAKTARRARRVVRIRRRVTGMPDRPRLAIFKSLHHIYAQVIDDVLGKTVAAAATTEKALASAGKTGNAQAAAKIGELIAERAKKAGVKQVVFDRRGFKYHGRVKALADAARKAGLEF